MSFTTGKSRRCVLAVCAFSVWALAVPQALALQAGDLADDVRRLISAKKFGEAKVGVSLMDGASGAVLGAHRADEAFIPASNMKLLTSGAALLILGPDFAFRTELVSDGERLIFRGSGDPSLADPSILEKMTPRMTVSDMLDAMVGAATKAKITQASELVIDDRVFDRELVHPMWPADQLTRGYCAQVSGVNFHANVLHVFPGPSPSGPGHAAVYTLQPEAPWLRFEVRARTVAQGSNSPWLTRDADGSRFVLRGDVRHRSLSPIEVTVHDPSMFLGNLLAERLAKGGVVLSGAERVRLALPDEVLSAGATLAVVSTPLAEVLKRCNADSANLYAEAMLKRIGHDVTHEPGSWKNGAAVVRMLLTERVGADAAASTVISDGSGMSRGNAVSPSTMTRWVRSISRDKAVGHAFRESMAEIGEGTLRRRFQGTKLTNRLQAKSGYLNGVRCLSGTVTHEASGRFVTFSVLVNNIRTDEQHRETLQLHEDIVRLADRWLSARIAAEAPALGG
jgi:D-alanyl-D-alanine carboxypeptidase/D-alanyl-D-alanine-endopeptidase (penicillin-binding protein 4)